MTKHSWAAVSSIYMASLVAALAAYALSMGINGVVLTTAVGAIAAIAGFRVGKVWKGK